MCVGIDRGRPAPNQGNDVSLTRSTRDNRKVLSNLQIDSLNWGGGEGREKLNRGRGEWETQTSFVQSMMVGQTRQQMKLTQGNGIIAVIPGMSLQMGNTWRRWTLLILMGSKEDTL